MKKRSTGQCVYCLRDPIALTEDHVFPGKWYPPTTPADLEKWKVPACYECNHQSGGNENDLLIRLGLCVHDQDPESRYIREKARRSIDPESASSAEDRLHRQMKREKLRSELRPITGADLDYFLPGFSPIPGTSPEGLIRLPINAEQMKAFGKKLVRALHTFSKSGLFQKRRRYACFFLTSRNSLTSFKPSMRREKKSLGDLGLLSRVPLRQIGQNGQSREFISGIGSRLLGL